MYENIVLKPPLFEIGLKGYLFGKDVINIFLEKYDFDFICRSHQVVE